jgi:xanthine dehydrogenase accessory factor
MASAAARLAFLAGFRVLVLELESPLAVRRRVCYAEAVRAGRIDVEGVAGEAVTLEALAPGRPSFVEVAVDPRARALGLVRPDVLVDGRMAKEPADTGREQAPLVIGMGPGFEAGLHVHAVVETQRGPFLGRVLWSGAAEPDTGVPAQVGGVSEGRVLRAPCAGRFQEVRAIGDVVAMDDTVAEIAGVPVRAGVAGLVRGLAADGVIVPAGLKVGDIDPRGRAVDASVISDKARAVAAGVMEAVLIGLSRL